MTIEKCHEVLDRYDEVLSGSWAGPGKGFEQIKHLTTMMPKMREMLDAVEASRWDAGVLAVTDAKALEALTLRMGATREKFMRWLGFMQGVLFCNGIYTIDEMKDHNRSDTP